MAKAQARTVTKEVKRKKREGNRRTWIDKEGGKDEGGQIDEETCGKRTHFLRSPLARGHGAMGQTAASLPSTKVPVWYNWLLLAHTLKL